MEIIGTGVDIENIERFRKKSFEKDKRFFTRIFTQKEIDYCLSKKSYYQHFAVRFCAKEALAKALPQSLVPGWTEVEILNDKIGRPEVIFSVKDKVKQARLNKLNVRVSMSHNDTQAIAFVVVQDKSSRPQKFSI